jgi:hypothetical protein
MEKQNGTEKGLNKLPICVVDFIKLVIKKMRYRKKVRAEVMAELAAHFEDELQSCKTDEEKEQKAQRLIEDFGDVKLLAVLLRRAKKRCRPLWRTVVARTFQTIGVLILCFIVYCIYISLGRPTINVNYVEEATRLTRPVADENLNAAPIYQKAIDAYKEPPLVEYETGGPKISLLDAIKNKDLVTELTEEELALLKQWLSDNSEAIDLYVQASKRPCCWWHRKLDKNKDTLMSLLLPELKPMRDLSKLIGWQIKMKAEHGDVEGAFQDIFAIYKTGEHFKGPRMLIEQLVGIGIQNLAIRNAFQIIAKTELNDEMLQHIQSEFQLLVGKAIFRTDFKTESFLLLDFIQRCYTNDGKGSGHMVPAGLKRYFGEDDYLPNFDRYFPALGASLISPDRKKMTEMVQNYYDPLDEWSQLTPWQLHKRSDIDFEFGINQWPRIKQIRYWPIMILLPAVGGACQIPYRIKADSEAFITVVALQRYQRQNGRYPETLDVLIQTKLLKELPMDPFSDQPLVYKKTTDNFTLYSVGLNFKDDGGQVYRDKKGKVKLWADEADAVFWPVQK